MMLTDRFSEALVFAEKLHREQTRKGNDIPYVAHLLAVAAMVLEYGGDEDTAIAALLHDAVEDQGGLKTRDEIEGRFGGRVAGIVMACTDSDSADPGAKSPWESRKRPHIEKLRSADRDVALVTAADKLHNLNAMIRDVRRHGRRSSGSLPLSAWPGITGGSPTRSRGMRTLLSWVRCAGGSGCWRRCWGTGGRARPPEVPGPDRCPELHLVVRQL